MRAVFFGGPLDAQERVADRAGGFRLVRMQTGEIIKYDLLWQYGDTLIYAHGLTMCQVMDLLVNYYCVGDDDA
jgi:hypothetical protein